MKKRNPWSAALQRPHPQRRKTLKVLTYGEGWHPGRQGPAASHWGVLGFLRWSQHGPPTTVAAQRFV